MCLIHGVNESFKLKPMQSNLCFHLVNIRCNGFEEITITKSHMRNMEDMYEGQPLPDTPCPQKLAITMRQVFMLAYYMTIHTFTAWEPWTWLKEKLTLWHQMTTVIAQWNSKEAKWPLQLSGYKMKSNVQAIWITVFHGVHWALNSSSKGLIVISCDIMLPDMRYSQWCWCPFKSSVVWCNVNPVNKASCPKRLESSLTWYLWITRWFVKVLKNHQKCATTSAATIHLTKIASTSIPPIYYSPHRHSRHWVINNMITFCFIQFPSPTHLPHHFLGTAGLYLTQCLFHEVPVRNSPCNL